MKRDRRPHPRPEPVGRVPLSDLVLMSNGAVCAPLDWLDDDHDECDPDSELVAFVIINAGGRFLAVELDTLPFVAIN